jgi:hypothetical protein
MTSPGSGFAEADLAGAGVVGVGCEDVEIVVLWEVS